MGSCPFQVPRAWTLPLSEAHCSVRPLPPEVDPFNTEGQTAEYTFTDLWTVKGQVFWGTDLLWGDYKVRQSPVEPSCPRPVALAM